MRHLKTETRYGLPSDPFVKVVTTWHLSDDEETVHKVESIFARGQIESIQCAVAFDDGVEVTPVTLTPASVESLLGGDPEK
jgi:hypothetical protein